jgi:hypothetical protein
VHSCTHPRNVVPAGELADDPSTACLFFQKIQVEEPRSTAVNIKSPVGEDWTFNMEGHGDCCFY